MKRVILLFFLAACLAPAGAAVEGYADGSGVSVVQDNGQIAVELVDSFVWRTGYYLSGDAWKPFEFAGEGAQGWVRGRGRASLSVDELGAGETFVIAYSCRRLAVGFDCHGGKWLLREVDVLPGPQEKDSPVEGDVLQENVVEADVLAEEWGDEELLANLETYKGVFSETNDVPTPPGEDSFGWMGGEGKVLLTVPHAVRQVREGAEKASDYCTGPLAWVVHDVTNAPVLYLKYKSRDPNYYDDVAFKDALAVFLEGHPEVEVVLDVHGAARSREWDVDLGYMDGASLLTRGELPSVAEGIFAAHGLSDVSHNYFAASVQDTVTKFVSQKFGESGNRAAMQVEINRRFRCDTDEKTLQAVRALAELVGEFQ